MKLRERNYNLWLKSADQYRDAALPQTPREVLRGVLNETIQYNLFSLSLECYMLAILDYHHTVPMLQRFSALLDALESIMGLPDRLRAKILKYESMQSIGNIEKSCMGTPDSYRIDEIRDAVDQMRALAVSTCLPTCQVG